MEKNRPGEQFDIQEDERGTYIMNSKDLCLIDYLPELMRAGVCSLKIEGRMKSVHYVATVVSTYRKAIDSCFANIEKYKVRKAWREELEKVSHRPYTTGFALGKPDENSQVYTTSSNFPSGIKSSNTSPSFTLLRCSKRARLFSAS